MKEADNIQNALGFRTPDEVAAAHRSFAALGVAEQIPRTARTGWEFQSYAK